MYPTKNDFQGNIERFSGFADLYDSYRPEPPASLAEVLTRLARRPFPDLVVDLGSGTGLSTRYWAGRARWVVGVEPTADMRRQAAQATQAANVSYREGFSHQTGLPDGCAQIVTCSQSLHWMEPEATFKEAARILGPGGVFAAFDYDWPPTTGSWEADAAYEACVRQVAACEKGFTSGGPPVRRWEKNGHLERMRASGCFRYTKEILLQHTDLGGADRLLGLLMSQGIVMTLLKGGLSEAELGIPQFRQAAQQALGSQQSLWYWSSRLRIGVV
jgi:ubiquinone/menaquinone biosynthesis C-methylase UbiE